MIHSRIRSVLEYLLVILIMLEFNTPYKYFRPFMLLEKYGTILVLFLLVCLSLRKAKGQKIVPLIFLYCTGAIVPLLMSGHKKNFIVLYIIYVILLWFYMYCNKMISKERYLSVFAKFSNVVTITALISLFFWVSASLLELFDPNIFFPSTWNQTGTLKLLNCYWGIYFETQQVQIGGLVFWRNSGIFQEGPMYNMVLCSAFLIESFIRQDRSRLRMLILLVSILTTVTTTGQLFLLIIAFIFINKRISFRRHVILYSIIIVVALIGMYVASQIIMTDKIESDSGGSSVDIRMRSIMNCISVGLENPFLGVGFLREIREIDEHSNSFFEVFAYGGFYGLIYYVGSLLLIPFLYFRKHKDLNWLIAMACFFFVFCVTLSEYRYLTLFFVAWGLSNVDLKRPRMINSVKRLNHHRRLKSH